MVGGRSAGIDLPSVSRLLSARQVIWSQPSYTEEEAKQSGLR
jgi:hypothetical protein